VLLVSPDHLAPVPCCSVTRETLRNGIGTDRARALRQHRALADALHDAGVRTRMVAGDGACPDMAYARDAGLMTPWGYLPLAPGAPHRRREAELLAAHVAALDIPVLPQVRGGTVEGGDISIFREGLVVIGCSGERTDEGGAAAVAGLFESHGWRALIYRFDPHFLHLDTQFSALGAHAALACVDVLDDAFLAELAAEGLELCPVSYKAARRLGCNVLALGGGRVLAAAGAGVGALLRPLGYEVQELELDEFTRCGGGVHCLTLPLARE
jgi:N-dimethylarginine dimethylaminohydrolase